MVDYQILDSEPIGNPQMQEVIKKKEEERELTYREDKIKQHLKYFTKISNEEFLQAKEEIKALEIPRLEEPHVIKIIDVMPKNGTELRAIVSNSGTVLVDESVTKILEVLNKYRPQEN